MELILEKLVTQIEFLNDKIEKLNDSLENQIDESEKLRFRLSELENSLDR